MSMTLPSASFPLMTLPPGFDGRQTFGHAAVFIGRSEIQIMDFLNFGVS